MLRFCMFRAEYSSLHLLVRLRQEYCMTLEVEARLVNTERPSLLCFALFWVSALRDIPRLPPTPFFFETESH